MEDKPVIKEWLEKAKKDLSEVEFLFKNSCPLEGVGFFIQQSAQS